MSKAKTVLLALAFATFSTASCSKEAPASGEPRKVEIAVNAAGYSPATIDAKKGENLVLRFTRTVKGECLSQVVFPEQKITKDLPMNEPVEIAIKADKAGKIPFQCGMAMVHGSINVTGS